MSSSRSSRTTLPQMLGLTRLGKMALHHGSIFKGWRVVSENKLSTIQKHDAGQNRYRKN